jgi:hypothetical protein
MVQRFSASKAAMLMSCPASADLERAITGYTAPVEDRTADNAANRGTAKHEMLEPIKELTASEIRAMGTYLTWLGAIRSKRRFKVLVEQKVKATWLQTEPTTTADQVLYVADEIHVIDDKWGKIPVSVHDNAQLLFYAVCYANLAPKAPGVNLHIAQPLIDNYESTFISAADLNTFMLEAQAAEQRIIGGDLTFGPSDHCTFCPANPHGRGARGTMSCPAMTNLLYPRVVDEDAILNEM